MKCPRCEGLMVNDQIFDPKASVRRIDIWRCLNCGETIDQSDSRFPNAPPAHSGREKNFQTA
jgi:hypothetical protein